MQDFKPFVSLLMVILTLFAVVFIKMEVMKNFVYYSVILAPNFQSTKHKGRKIVSEIFKALHADNNGYLLPHDFKTMLVHHKHNGKNQAEAKRVICDFVAGMTDRYAADFHKRLHYWDSPSVQQPI